ncbi:MAG: endonuclease/exonuclease/phosphatase family protein [Halieaceae bacterium]|nr:endonuclease/exonuclease/phosphatase family protein [Halieaceae bacterium]
MSAADYSRSFRVCSWNIHKGFGPDNRRFRLEDMRDAIRSVDADICFLQEVVGHRLAYRDHPLPGTESQFEFLADRIWHHYAYGRNAIVEDGHHGNAILSKVPFVSWRNYDITRWRFSRRGLLLGRLDNGVVLICAHLGLLATEQRFQLKRLKELVLAECRPSDPVIVAGDFNDWRRLADPVMMGELGFAEIIAEQTGRPARSFPAILPLLRVDRVYFRGLALEEARLLRGGVWNRLSDHAALTAQFRLLA